MRAKTLTRQEALMQQSKTKSFTIEPPFVPAVSENQKELFNTVMSNLKEFGRDQNGTVIISSGSIPLSLLFVDARYQGLRKHNHIRSLEKNWDIRKLGPITVVPHYESYCFAIVDGQGRYLVAPTKGMTNLRAVVLMDAPQDPVERLKFEAEYFIGQDMECEEVKPLEKHLARVIIGDKGAVALDKMFKKYGIQITGEKGPRGKGVLGSYTDAYDIAKVHGEKCVDFIFSIIENAEWNKEPNGYSTYVLRALKDLWIAHPNERETIHKYVSKELKNYDPYLFCSKSRAKYDRRDHRAACSLYLEDLVCEGLKIEKKIYIEGERSCKVIP